MYKIFIIATICMAAVLALPYDVVQDAQGQEYYLVPLSRARRGTVDWDVRKPGIGYVEGRENIFKNDDHKVDAAAFAQKNFATHGNAAGGGKIEYSHLPSGSSLSAMAKHTEHRGDDLAIQGKWNIYQKGNAGVDLTGNYQRHYGGPGGTRDPSFGAMLNGHLDF